MGMNANVNEETKELETSLCKWYPGREIQIRILLDTLYQPRQYSPASIFIYDPHTPTSSTSIVRKVLVSPNVIVEIDPLLCPTPRSLFTQIWNSLYRLEAISSSTLPAVMDDSLDLFLGSLSTAMESIIKAQGKLVLLLQRAERMRDVWPEPVIEALYNMAETISAKGHFTLVMISTLPTSQFRTTRGVGLDDALVIPFPRLSKEDALVSLELDAEALIKADERHTEPIEVLSRLHSAFIEVAYDSFASDIRDLEEIRLMACCVWYPFIEPLLLGAVEVKKTQALLSRSSYLFRDALTRLHTREICPTEWVIQMVNRVKTETQANSNQITTIHNSSSLAKSIAIPLIPSFLLLASFLASYNPARLDVSYFVRDESALLPEGNDQRTKGLSKKKKRKRITRRKGAGGGSGQNRQEMLGPKTFALDRLLSIFQSLMTEAGPEVPGWMGEEESQVKSDWWEVKSKSTAVMEATNTLIRMGFLVRTSAAERLEGTTLLRTNVTFEAISQVSRRVKFDLQEWLWDWNQ